MFVGGRTFFRLNNSLENNSMLNDSKVQTGHKVSFWSRSVVVENNMMFLMFSPYSFDIIVIHQYKENGFCSQLLLFFFCLLQSKIDCAVFMSS